MIHCDDCGRWIFALDYKKHEEQHRDQLLLDHTGPHGDCAQKKVTPFCQCPDPVYRAGSVACGCCEGSLAKGPIAM